MKAHRLLIVLMLVLGLAAPNLAFAQESEEPIKQDWASLWIQSYFSVPSVLLLVVANLSLNSSERLRRQPERADYHRAVAVTSFVTLLGINAVFVAKNCGAFVRPPELLRNL